MPTAAALGSLESDGSRDLFFAGSDAADCFYRLEVPDGLEEYVSLLGLTADVLIEIRQLLKVPKQARLVP